MNKLIMLPLALYFGFITTSLLLSVASEISEYIRKKIKEGKEI